MGHPESAKVAAGSLACPASLGNTSRLRLPDPWLAALSGSKTMGFEGS